MKNERAKTWFYRRDQYDNDVAFLRLIEAQLQPGMQVLDAGAGAGQSFRHDLKTRVAKVIGVDLDPRVVENPLLHEGHHADLTAMPIESGSVDLIFSHYVLEHVQDPQAVLREIHRVLKPHGRFLFLTPNKWHYVSIASRFAPHGFHVWYNRKRGRNDSDTFPTVYKLNSRRDIRREFSAAGFVEREMLMRECCPNYLTFALPAFLLGVAYERLVNSCNCLAGYRVNIIGDFEKAN